MALREGIYMIVDGFGEKIGIGLGRILGNQGD